MNKYSLFLMLAGLAAAQVKPPNVLTYEFKNVDLDRADSIVRFVQKLDPSVIIQFDGPFRTAVIRSNYSADLMKQALELLARYDVAPPPLPKVEFVAYLVRAAEYESRVPAKPIPSAIEDAVAEMKRTLPYKYYSLLDTVSTDVHHHAEVDSVVPQIGQNGGLQPFTYHVVYGDTAVSPDGKTVVVNPFKFSMRVPDWPEATGFTTDVTIQEGQKLVLGKVRISIIDSTDIFVVLTVKLH